MKAAMARLVVGRSNIVVILDAVVLLLVAVAPIINLSRVGFNPKNRCIRVGYFPVNKY
jgi:hypothetical protein